MSNMQILSNTDTAIAADIAALWDHQRQAARLMREPFRLDKQEQYAPGDVVWMWDHYSTGVIVGPSVMHDGTQLVGHWRVKTWGADGREMLHDYISGGLRPAAAPHVIVWSRGNA